MESPDHQTRRVTEYVELEAEGEKVTRAEKISTETVLGTTHDIWDVVTDKDRYWVVTEPTNLYSQSDFPSMDQTLTFHVGLGRRIVARQRSGATEEEVWRAPKTWRQFEQAADTLDDAREAEDFQAVGVKCREILITFVNEINLDLPGSILKKSDVVGRLSEIYDTISQGSSMSEVRGHLKSGVSTVWSLVGWLTHYKNALYDDAFYVLHATEQILLNTMLVLRRSETPPAKRCPSCKSYQVIEDFRSDLFHKGEHPYISLCEACGWEEDVKPA